MKPSFNLRHLEKKDLLLRGSMSPEELELGDVDEVIQTREPLAYDLRVELLDSSILVQGSLSVTLDCQCVRCLKEVQQRIELPEWVCDLPLEGEDRVAVENDCVDLTPFIREDILLAFPQHPLCEAECSGLLNAPQNQSHQASGVHQTENSASAWAELNKLKLK
jgi:uncharacterized protein